MTCTSGALCDIIINIIGGASVVVIIEYLIKPIIAYCRNKKYTKKKYIHCETNYEKAGNGITDSYTEITIKFMRPNVLFLKSCDKGNEWMGEINLNSFDHVAGIGNYRYTDKDSIASGTLNVYAIEDGRVFSVKSDDFRKDKIVSYLWVEENDKRIKNKD